MEKILFTGENGEKVEFFVIEEAKHSDKDLTYEFVEDEKEIEAVAGLLEELLDGEVDLVPEEDE